MMIRRTIYAVLLIGWLMAGAQAQVVNELSVPELTVSEGSTVTLPVSLRNTSTDIVGVQFDLTVPASMKVDADAARLTERTRGYTVTANARGEGHYTFMLFSLSQTPIRGTDGELLQIPVTLPTVLEADSTYVLQLSRVILSTPRGDNVVTGTHDGTLRPKPTPDFEVKAVEVTPSHLMPGDTIDIRWTVRNVGTSPATGSWSERIAFVGTDGSESHLITTLPDASALAVGDVVLRQVSVAVPAALGIDGQVAVRVTLIPDTDAGEGRALQANNTATTEGYGLHVGRRLWIAFPTESMDESASGVVQGQLTRSGQRAEAETFTLRLKGDDRLVAPDAVTIPAGQSSTRVYLTLKDNDSLDEDSLFLLTAEGDSYEPATATLCVRDDELPHLNLHVSTDEVTEGTSFTLTIGAERAVETALQVALSTELPARFSLPAGVIIPAGERTATVNVTATDNDEVELATGVAFQASAPGFISGTAIVVLTDNDMPSLSLDLSPEQVNEAAGPATVVGTIRRSDHLDKRVTVRLTEDSEGSIYLSTNMLVMEAGIAEAQFCIGTVDNNHVDGVRTIHVTAAVYASSCNCSAQGESRGAVTADLLLLDDDGPALKLSANASAWLEGSTNGRITVSHNIKDAKDMTVRLSSNADERVTYNPVVTIPAGESSVSVPVSVKTNSTEGDDRLVTFTAQAEGAILGTCWVQLTDHTLPDVIVSHISVSPAQALAGDTVMVTVTLTNIGTSPLPPQTQVSIYLSGADGRKQTYTQEPIPVGESLRLTTAVQLPAMTGTYAFSATANENRANAELLYANNASGRTSVTIRPSFAATVATDKQTYMPSDTVLISGQATGRVGQGTVVEVYVINDGLRQVLPALADANGRFTARFAPYARQLGSFSVGACFPGENLATEMASFDVQGIKLGSFYQTTQLNEEETFNGSFTLSNPSRLPVTGLKAVIDGQTENASLVADIPAIVNARSQVTIPFRLTAKHPSTGTDYEQADIRLTTAEGLTQTFHIYYYVRTLRGKLTAGIDHINTTMIKGQTRDYSLTIANAGQGETGRISVTTGATHWLSTATPSVMPSLKSGESTTIVLRMTPTDEMQLNNPIKGQLVISCENGTGLTLPMSVEPVSEATGTLTVDVCDMATYHSEAHPHVGNARVTVQHPTTKAVIQSAATGTDGRCSFTLPEGYYFVAVTHPDHESWSGNLLVNPGKDTFRTVNIVSSGISIDMQYTPTEIPDVYGITTTMTFAENVLEPVVVTDVPARIAADELQPGQSLVFLATLSNKGLIAAQQAQFILPTGINDLRIEPLGTTTYDVLEAGQSVTIPVKVTRKTNVEAPMKKPHRLPHFEEQCYFTPVTTWQYICGEDNIPRFYQKTVQVKNCGIALVGLNLPHVEPTIIGDFTDSIHIERPPFIVPDPRPTPPNPSPVLPPLPPSPPGPDPTTWFEIPEWLTEAINATLCNPCVKKYLNDINECMVQTALGGNGVISHAIDCAHDVGDCHQDDTEGFLGFARCASAYAECGATACEAIALAGQVAGVVSFNTGLFIGSEELHGTCDNAHTLLDALNCVLKLSGPCDSENDDNRREADDIIGDHRETAKDVAEELQAAKDKLTEIFGDDDWHKVPFDDWKNILDSLRFSGCPYPLPPASDFEPIDPEEVRHWKPEQLTWPQFEHFIERVNNTNRNALGLPVEGDNRVHPDVIARYSYIIHEIEEKAVKEGYTSTSDKFKEKTKDVLERLTEAERSVCASITLQLSQTMTMTRQAVRGTLTVKNGHKSLPMTDIRLNLSVLNAEGNLAGSDLMQIEAESLDGFDGQADLNTAWTLAPQKQGVATVLFIPTKLAAPVTETPYTFAGSLAYNDPFSGTKLTRELASFTIGVKPSPVLALDYFLQRNVIGDDPLTADTVEASLPTEFAILIRNRGYGDATNLALATRQPQVTVNRKGLVNDLRITGATLNGEERNLLLDNTVATDFGNIPAHTTAYAQWWMQSSYLGHFTKYDVSVNHVTSRGNENLSLVERATIHELIHGFDLVSPDGSRRRAFLVNDLPDNDDLPDAIFLTDGTETEVALARETSLSHTDGTSWQLDVVPANAGWNYGSLTDPTAGHLRLTEVIRQSDGTALQADHFWQTDVTLRDGKDPLREARIHFADSMAATGERYLLRFEAPDESPTSADVTIPEGQTMVTFCHAYDLDFSDATDDCRAYVVSRVEGDVAICEEVFAARGGTGLLFHGVPGTYTFPVRVNFHAPANLLVGILAPTPVAPMTDDGRVNLTLQADLFQPIADRVLPAGCAYLSLPLPATVQQLRVQLGVPDDVQTILLPLREEWFNIAGQRVSQPRQKGVYVTRNRKRVIR